MPIYTKKGDNGKTTIVNKRLSKSSYIIEAIGTIDELISNLGIIIAKVEYSEEIKNEQMKKKLIKRLKEIQKNLFTINSIIAGAVVRTGLDLPLQNKKEKKACLFLNNKLTENLEKEIDTWTEKLPELRNFILPGGSILASQIHQSRTICRRAERRYTVFISNKNKSKHQTYNQKQLDEIQKYINRLSDWLFTLARYINHNLKIKENIWKL